MASPETPSLAQLERLFILGFTYVEEYCKLLELPIGIINDSKDIYQLTKDVDWLRTESVRALSAGCIFMACKQAKIDIELAWMVYEMMGDMDQSLEMLWVIEHLVAGVKPTVELPAVRYEQAEQGEANTYIIKKQAKKIILSWPSVIDGTDTVLLGNYSTNSPSLMTLYNKAVWQTAEEILTKPTLRKKAEQSTGDP